MTSYEDIAPKAAHDRIGDFRVIDVRGDAEFTGPLGRIPGSERIVLDEIVARSDEFAPREPLLLVCRSGRRSGFACEKLLEAGIDEVSNLEGGMIAWIEAGLPVDRSPVTSARALVEQLATWLGQVTPLSHSAAVDELRIACDEAGASIEAPNHAAIQRTIERVGELAVLHGPPQDLQIVLTSARRSLDTL